MADALEHPRKTTSSSHLDAREMVVAEVLKQLERTTGSCLDAREVVAMADTLERPKKNTSDSRLHAREVVVVTERLKRPKKPTFGSYLNAREVVVVAGRYVWSSSDSNRSRWAGFSRVGPPLVVVVIAGVARRCCAVITHRRCGAVGVFRLRFVHYVGVKCKVVKTYHMGLPFHGSPLVPPPLSPVPSEHERNLPTSLKRGEGAWAGYAFDVTAHIPQARGGAGGWDVRYQPTSLRRGEGQEAGSWRLEVVVVVDQP